MAGYQRVPTTTTTSTPTSLVSSVLVVYSALFTLQPGYNIPAGATGLASIPFLSLGPEHTSSSTATSVTFTAVTAASAFNTAVPVAVTGSLTDTAAYPGASATAVFFLPVPGTDTGVYSPVTSTLGVTPISTLTLPPATVATSSGLTESSFTGQDTTPTSSSDQSSSTTVTTPSAQAGIPKKSYSAGELAGAAVGCAFAGVLVACLLLWVFLRRRAAGKYRAIQNAEKQAPLLRGHGEAVYIAADNSDKWEKHLPQADSDNTIRSMTSRTLDQIAMHVENFYCSKRGIVLSTEQQFALEAIDSSRLSEPISTLLQRPYRTEDLIKHYMSSYIISMISFEDVGAAGNFLPKLFRRQWQPFLREAEVPSQAYSQWRVLTAYLRQLSGDEHAYMAERNAAIDTAARHLCRALEPWAKTETDHRFQNTVSIMKRASELGILLFSQRARFEWQWALAADDRPSIPSGMGEMVILPGLYKVTDQNAVLLAMPLSIVEPVVVR